MKKILRVFIAAFLILAGYLALAILPYSRQPQVKQTTKDRVELRAFCQNDDGGERVKVISDNGEALEERIRLISNAKEEIILSTFRFENDKAGRLILAALADAASRGVKVKVLSDGFSYLTTMMGDPYFLAAASMDQIEFKVYNPVRLWKPWTFMGRLHDKYLIVDKTAFILGGRNTFRYFLGDQPGHKNYDWDMFVYDQDPDKEGSMEELLDYFDKVWNGKECSVMGKSLLWRHNPSVKKAGKELASVYENMCTEHGDWIRSKDYAEYTLPVNHIQLIGNPIHTGAKEPLVFYLMTELMKNADKEVVIHTPYVICDDWMMDSLREVCDSVDTVRMMTNSVANNGNPFGAMDYNMNKGKLIDTGVHIMEYDGGVSYHGKCFTMDDRIAAIGSFNWDMRSAYLDTELMLVVDSVPVTQQLRKAMETYEKDALLVTGLETYELKEGQEPQKQTEKKKSTIKLIETFGKWARFLF